MPTASLPEAIASIDALIRSGDADKARAELRALASTKIDRAEILPVARLARRANLPELTIRWLNPIVRPGPKSPAIATAEEKAEYAAALTKIGAPEEAIVVLKRLPAETLPEVWLYRAFALISGWNYAEAVPLLEQYVASARVGEYERLVGKVNLAAALVTLRQSERAATTLEAVRDQTRSQGYSLLYGNTLELMAQNAIFSRRWSEAREYLELAASELGKRGSLWEFFVRKWKAVLALLRDGATPTALEQARAIRDEGREREHWETVRDLDRFIATATADESLLTYVYFGTPFETFRQRLLTDYGQPLRLPEAYVRQLDDSAPVDRIAIDLATGVVSTPGDHSLKAGQLLHRLLAALASDFYRPFRVAQLHYRLYPDQFFNPVSSPLRVHQALIRLRTWIVESHLPIAVDEHQGHYRLVSRSPCAIAVPIALRLFGQPGSGPAAWSERLRKRWPEGDFSAVEASQLLGVSSRSVLRALKSEMSHGSIVRSGTGAATRYQFTPKRRKA